MHGCESCNLKNRPLADRIREADEEFDVLIAKKASATSCQQGLPHPPLQQQTACSSTHVDSGIATHRLRVLKYTAHRENHTEMAHGARVGFLAASKASRRRNRSNCSKYRRHRRRRFLVYCVENIFSRPSYSASTSIAAHSLPHAVFEWRPEAV